VERLKPARIENLKIITFESNLSTLENNELWTHELWMTKFLANHGEISVPMDR
jgi:hypothetical protein